MDDAQLRLELFRLSMRLTIVERLTLRSYFYGPVAAGLQTRDESLSMTLKVLENTASGLEKLYLSDKGFAWTDAQRALYADEIRELVNDMKSYVTNFKSKVEKAVARKRKK